MKTFKLSQRAKMQLQVLIGMLLVQPIGWQLCKLGALGTTPWQFRAGALAVLFVVGYVWFLRHGLSADQTEVKPKWWR